MRLIVLTFVFSIVLTTGFTQSIQNINASVVNGRVTVTYDLVGSKPEQSFIIELFGSHNNFSSPLQKVAGDVGKNVKGDIGKKIYWDAEGELGNNIDQVKQITFKVKAELTALPFTIKSPAEGTIVSKGKNIMVKWDGGKANQKLVIELLKGNEVVRSMVELPNTGQYDWSIPGDLEKGTYSFKLTGGQESAQSGSFTIKSKTPLWMKLVPPVIAVGVLAALFMGGGGDEDAPVVTNNDLPVPPGPK